MSRSGEQGVPSGACRRFRVSKSLLFQGSVAQGARRYFHFTPGPLYGVD